MLGEKLRSAIDKISGARIINEQIVKESIKDIQRALINSNVEINTVLNLSKKIEKKALEKPSGNLSQKEHITKVIYDELIEMLGGKEYPKEPKKILLCGLFGSGKTTATGKLGLWYKKRGRKVGVIAADTYRPAAYEQLETNAKTAGIDFFGIKKEKNPSKIIKEALKKFETHDLIICDSAGRSGLDEELVLEIQDIDKTFNADEKWLVISADIGNLAKKQAQAFHNAIGVNGVIITKMDGSSKGGGAIVACNETGSSVYFISTGEKINEFEAFDANRYLSKIMGYGDLEGLLEKVKEIEMDNLSPEEMMKGNLNFKIFYEQLKATKKLGPLNKVMEMLGMGNKLPKEAMEIGQEKMESFKIIIDSMTEQERIEPDLLNRSRIERIAKGAGKDIKEIRELIKQFKKMKKMFKQFKGMNEQTMTKMGERDIGKLMQGLQGRKSMKKKFRLK
ncbi:MAG: signal recognition particle receptor subunit alpha [Candidatus ainarchaeum sp.]|nr:signal recognition particle receptor subunit alpha [Candidatus ainarchaeum sp.]